MVKSWFNSLSIPKDSCKIQSTNDLVLLIISLANAGFKSHINHKTIQNEKQEGQHSIHLNPQKYYKLLLYHVIEKSIYQIILKKANRLVRFKFRIHGQIFVQQSVPT